MTGRFLTARELAGRLGVSTSALLRWTRSGQVPAVKLPSGAVRYDPDRVNSWLDRRTMKAGGTEEESPTSNTTRQSRLSSKESPTVLRSVAAPTTEEDN
jgi:excisionase family DNA binding protein